MYFFSQKCSFEIWLINFLQALFLLEFYLLPNIVLFTFSSQLLICYCRECIGTKLLYTFPSPKPFHFCNSNFFSDWCLFYWRSQKRLAFTSSFKCMRGLPVFDQNLCSHGANFNAYIELSLLPWVQLPEMKILLKSCFGMQVLRKKHC